MVMFTDGSFCVDDRQEFLCRDEKVLKHHEE